MVKNDQSSIYAAGEERTSIVQEKIEIEKAGRSSI
jgi:hypothetical protein